MALYIISDLHLSKKHPELLEAFSVFVDNLNKNDRLIIAGDLFDFFVGIDKKDSAQRLVRDTLKKAKERGIKSYFITGNRDFLVGKRHARYFYMELLPDFYLIQTVKGPFLVTHGDMLCTNDKSYMRFKKWCQKPWLQALFKALPLSLRKKIGSNIRSKSMENKKVKGSGHKIYEVMPEAVDKYINIKPGIIGIIHGHTHIFGKNIERPSNAIRISLGAWGPNYSYIRSDTQGLAVVEKSLDSLFGK